MRLFFSDCGYNYRAIIGCKTSPTNFKQYLLDALATYKAAYAADATKPIVLTSGSLKDYQIKLAYDECIDENLGGGVSFEEDITSGSGFGGRINWREKVGQ